MAAAGRNDHKGNIYYYISLLELLAKAEKDIQLILRLAFQDYITILENLRG